jgi:hypothetical protein
MDRTLTTSEKKFADLVKKHLADDMIKVNLKIRFPSADNVRAKDIVEVWKGSTKIAILSIAEDNIYPVAYINGAVDALINEHEMDREVS